MVKNNIIIRPLKIDDFKYVLEWSRDEKFCLANGWDPNKSDDELYHWWIHFVNHQPKNFIRQGIDVEDRLIGYVDLANINENRAEIGIAIGDSRLWGKGYGSNAILLLIDFAKKEFKITEFFAETHETNIRSQRLLEKLGFKEINRKVSGANPVNGTLLIQYKFVKDD